MLEKTPESPLDSKIKPVNLKGNQPWILLGRIDAEAETPLFCHLTQTADWLEKSLMLGKIEDRRKRGCQRMRWLDGITDAIDMNLDKLQEMVRDMKAWHAAVHVVTKSWTWLGDLTTKTKSHFINITKYTFTIISLRKFQVRLVPEMESMTNYIFLIIIQNVMNRLQDKTVIMSLDLL